MQPGARTYKVYGLRIRSEVPLPVPSVEDDGDPDLVVRWGPRAEVPDAPPEGALWGVMEKGYRRCWVTETANGYTVRFNLYGDFHIAPRAGTIEVRLDRRQGDYVVGHLLLRNVLIQLLRLNGSCVLHASAVDLGGGKAIAIAGPGGAGKSTLAALFCAAGARLVTDDALRVDFVDRRAVCFAGPALIRLRPEGRSVVELFPEWARTGDGRLGITPASSGPGPLGLQVVLLLDQSQEVEEPRVTRLGFSDAMLALVSASGPQPGAEAGLRDVFHANAGLVERVPVLRAEVPRTAAPDTDLPGVLLGEAGLAPPT